VPRLLQIDEAVAPNNSFNVNVHYLQGRHPRCRALV